MSTQSIHDRLIEAADKELKAQIEETAAPLYNLLCNGCGHTITIDITSGVVVKVVYFAALQALKDKAFEMHVEKAREDRVAAFMSKVERIDGEMEELRQMARE